MYTAFCAPYVKFAMKIAIVFHRAVLNQTLTELLRRLCKNELDLCPARRRPTEEEMFRINLPFIPSVHEVVHAAQSVGADIASPFIRFYQPLYLCSESFRHTQYGWIHLDKAIKAYRQGKPEAVSQAVAGAVTIMIAVGFITCTRVTYVASLILDLTKCVLTFAKHLPNGDKDKIALATLDMSVDLAHLVAEVYFTPEIQLITLFTNILTDMWRASGSYEKSEHYWCGGYCSRILFRCGINYALPTTLAKRWFGP